MKPAVFLDRDGVINKMAHRFGKLRAPSRLEDFVYLEGVQSAALSLKSAGFFLVVVTNQPDVKRGWLTRDLVDAMNEKVRMDLGIDEIKICFHDVGDSCACRKPKPGMLLEAATTWGIDLQSSYMIGDRYTDVEAGKAVGCKTFLIGAGEVGEDPTRFPRPDYRVASLLEASQLILKMREAS